MTSPIVKLFACANKSPGQENCRQANRHPEPFLSMPSSFVDELTPSPRLDPTRRGMHARSTDHRRHRTQPRMHEFANESIASFDAFRVVPVATTPVVYSFSQR